jgi:hypothetical protein
MIKKAIALNGSNDWLRKRNIVVEGYDNMTFAFFD